MANKELVAQVRIEPQIASKKIEVGEWGIDIKQNLTVEEWTQAMFELQKYDGKIQWYLGDMVVYAQSDVTGWTNMKGMHEGHSKYDDMIAFTGYEYQTLSRFAQVARRFTNKFREDVLRHVAQNTNYLSFSHFRAVQSLEDDAARHFLVTCAEKRWTIRRLEDEVAKFKNKGKIEENYDNEPSPAERTFNEQKKKFFKGWFYGINDNQEYDEKTFLIELRDVVDEKLKELGVVDG